MKYPRIPHNIAVKFRLGMTAVMLLTGTPATSMTSHATETTGTEVTTQEQTSGTEQATSEDVTTETVTETVSTEATTEKAKVSKKKSKTEETVEELNKQTNNSKYTGNVTSSYSWTDSSGTHFRWSVHENVENERDEPWAWNIYIWISFICRTKTVKNKRKKKK